MICIFDGRDFRKAWSGGGRQLVIALKKTRAGREARERVKIAASQRMDMWMEVSRHSAMTFSNRKLVVNEEEAKTVRMIFHRHTELKSAPRPQDESPCCRDRQLSQNGGRRITLRQPTL